MLKTYAALCQSVTKFYETDPTTAGVITSWLPDKQKWYFSVVRFRQRYGRNKQVVCSAMSDHFDRGLKTVAKKWLDATHDVEIVGRDPRRRLLKILA